MYGPVLEKVHGTLSVSALDSTIAPSTRRMVTVVPEPDPIAKLLTKREEGEPVIGQRKYSGMSLPAMDGGRRMRQMASGGTDGGRVEPGSESGTASRKERREARAVNGGRGVFVGHRGTPFT